MHFLCSLNKFKNMISHCPVCRCVSYGGAGSPHWERRGLSRGAVGTAGASVREGASPPALTPTPRRPPVSPWGPPRGRPRAGARGSRSVPEQVRSRPRPLDEAPAASAAPASAPLRPGTGTGRPRGLGPSCLLPSRGDVSLSLVVGHLGPR